LDIVVDFPVHSNGLNSIRVTQAGLSQTCHGHCCKHLDMSRWFVSATFVIYVHDFPRGEVSVKVGVMEFGLYIVPGGRSLRRVKNRGKFC